MISRRSLLTGLGALAAAPAMQSTLGCVRGDTSTLILIAKIRIARNTWVGSKVSAEIGKQLVAAMGYEVEVVDVDEYWQFPRLASGDLHACLEVWPSRHSHERELYVDTGIVNDIGALGVIGRRGWYVPKYMKSTFSDLPSWEALKDPALISALATTSSAGKGRLLGVHPSYAQVDQQIISNLSLNLEIEWAGSLDAMLSTIDSAYAASQPLLFHHWEPTVSTFKWELLRIELPDSSSTCQAKASSGGVDCDYPLETLEKMASHELVSRASDVAVALSKIKIDTTTQEALIKQVAIDGVAVEDVVSAWFAANESTWKAWL
ncbi:MAG: glycine betaine ABC transporter substrate-binding protein [Polyangiaceae bacterium]